MAIHEKTMPQLQCTENTTDKRCHSYSVQGMDQKIQCVTSRNSELRFDLIFASMIIKEMIYL